MIVVVFPKSCAQPILSYLRLVSLLLTLNKIHNFFSVSLVVFEKAIDGIWSFVCVLETSKTVQKSEARLSYCPQTSVYF